MKSSKAWRMLLYLLLCVLLAPPSTLAKDNWVEKYVSFDSRPDSLLAPAHLANRKVFLLSGTWKARLAGTKNDVSVQVPGFYDFEGKVIFSRFFVLDSSFVNRRFKLVALGVNNACQIYLNDEFLTNHFGGHLPFEVELPVDHILIPGRNELRVVVDNTLEPKTRLPLQFSPGLLKNYGGIFRDIYVSVMPETSIESVRFKTFFSNETGAYRLHVSTMLKGKKLIDKDDELDLHIELVDSVAKRVVVAPEQEITSESTVFEQNTILDAANFQEWSPTSPALYHLRVSIRAGREILDEYVTPVGFNRVKVDSSRFALNGKPIKLLGVNWYEEYGQYGPIANRELIDQEVNLIKQLGANAVRVVGMPPHPYFVTACDRNGLLLFLEVPVAFVPNQRLSDPVFQEVVSNYYQEILEQYAGHPCIAGWGLGVDLQLKLERDYVEILKNKIMQFSQSPVYHVKKYYDLELVDSGANLVFSEPAGVSTVPFIPEQDGAAVIAVFGSPLKNLSREVPQDEDDGFSQQGEMMSAQEQQAYKLGTMLGDLAASRQEVGIFISDFSDWHAQRPILSLGPRRDLLLNSNGLYSYEREKRIAADIVESVFKGGQPKKIPKSTTSPANPNIYPIAGLSLILAFLFNFNRSRRFRANIKRAFIYPHGFFSELRENRKVPYLHTLLLSLIVTVLTAIIVSSLIYNYREHPLFDYLVDFIVGSPAMKSNLIWLVWHPVSAIIALVAFFYLFYLFLGALFKTTSIFIGRSLPFGQYFTLSVWVSACLIWLLPLIPIYYRIIHQTEWAVPALLIFASFVFWVLLRLFRGIKIIFFLSLFQALLLTGILATVVFGSMIWYFDSKSAITEYLPMFWEILQSRIGLG